MTNDNERNKKWCYTCKIASALMYPRMSLFEYPHPLSSAIPTNFS